MLKFSKITVCVPNVCAIRPPFELYEVGTVNDVTGKDPEGQEHHCP